MMNNGLSVRVTKKVKEAEDIVSLELTAIDDAPLPAFSAGSHIDVQLADGLTRQYSLCNDPSEQHRYLIAILRDPVSRGGSIKIHDEIREGDLLQISRPKNHFALTHASHSLLLAGGIGVTPILCMAERLATTGASFDMHYCSRSVERTAFRERIASSVFSDKVHFHFDDGTAEQKLNLPKVLSAVDSDTHLYVCGPTGFIDFVVNTAKDAGWAGDRIHFEYFGAAAQDASSNTSFEVKIASSGKTFTVPADRTVTTVLAENGIEIDMVCEQGVCGTCITRILDGIPDHRDQFFSDEEKAANDQFTPCCSRSKSKCLVLDL
jgi:vanillate O-demethylase ferredoxin subunit